MTKKKDVPITEAEAYHNEQHPLREQSVQSLYLDEHGREVPNPIPMQPPIGYVRRDSIADQMRRMIQQVSEEARMAGAETEEEANDFDIGEDFEPSSQWEDNFEVDPTLEAMLALQSKPPVVPPKPEAPSQTAAGSPAAASVIPPAS